MRYSCLFDSSYASILETLFNVLVQSHKPRLIYAVFFHQLRDAVVSPSGVEYNPLSENLSDLCQQVTPLDKNTFYFYLTVLKL